VPTKKRDSRRSLNLRILAMLLVGGGLLVIGVAALLLLPKESAPESEIQVAENKPAEVDFPAPDLQLRDLDGQPVSLTDYRGQVVLVNNWATWCPPCRQEMPILEAYFRDHNHQDFTIVAIDAGDPADTVSAFVNQYQMSFPVWLDPSSFALNSFRNNYLPSSYLINRDGQVVKAWSGAVTQASLEENITPLLME
jgi:cytochrome c biogenesis protein CcmG/thiol:disulfide interchange protein DsbE